MEAFVCESPCRNRHPFVIQGTKLLDHLRFPNLASQAFSRTQEVHRDRTDQGRRSQLCSQKPVKVIEECAGRLTDHCEEAFFGVYSRQSYLAFHGIVGIDPEVPPP
jgi:hypothetical protein